MKSIRRILATMLTAIFMVSMISTSAYAAGADNISSDYNINEDNLNDETPSTYKDYTAVSGVIYNNNLSGSLKLYPSCNQGGLFVKLHLSTYSASTSGILLIKMYDKNGKVVSDDWMMGVNDEATFKLPLFSPYGTYTVEIHAQGITSNVNVRAYISS